jgi:alpha-L-fucosidase
MVNSPYHFENRGAQKNWNSSQIHQWSTSVSSTSALERITLPTLLGQRLHIFAISISPSSVPSGQASGPALSVRRVRFTSRWEIVDGSRVQAVEITLANLLPSYLFSVDTSITSRYHIEVSGTNVQTVSPGTIYRLVPADQVLVDVLISNSATSGNATVEVKDPRGNAAVSRGWPITPLQQKWTADSLGAHETPTWVRPSMQNCLFLTLKIISVEPGQIWHFVRVQTPVSESAE